MPRDFFGNMSTARRRFPPNRYASRMRLEKAKAELAAYRSPLAEIAPKARFSFRASITRVFHRATGVTSKE